MGALGYVEYVMFFVFCALVVLLSFILDKMWGRILPHRVIHRIFVTPGIIVHELSHAFACLITGAKITEIKFFDEEGGHVTHGKSKIPVLGQVMISLAPLFGIPLFLLLLALVAKVSGLAWFPGSLPHINSPGSFWDFIVTAFNILWQNFWVRHYWWFVVFLYLAFSLVVCLAPSGPDFRNSIIGISVIFVLGLLFLAAMHILVNGMLGINWSTPVLRFVISWLYYAVGIGFVLELITLVFTIPLFILVWVIRRRG